MITSTASIARSISSSQTDDQNSIPCRETSSTSHLIAAKVICKGINNYQHGNSYKLGILCKNFNSEFPKFLTFAAFSSNIHYSLQPKWQLKLDSMTKFKTYWEQSLAHIYLHMFIIKWHNLHNILQSCYSELLAKIVSNSRLPLLQTFLGQSSLM